MTKIELELTDFVRIIREQTPSSSTFTPPFNQPYIMSAARDFGISIVIADRGHVWVGPVILADGFATITGGAAVRIWGTTNGLGQLAKLGPTINTVLDAVPTVHVRESAVISYIPCEASAWIGKL